MTVSSQSSQGSAGFGGELDTIDDNLGTSPANYGGASTGGINGGFGNQSNQSSGTDPQVAQLKNKAVSRLTSEVDSRKGVVSDQLRQVSSAVRSATDSLQSGDGQAPQWLATGMRQISEKIDSFASTVQDRSADEMIGEVRSFARTNPALFIGGCALVGFAAARVLTAGAGGPSRNESGISGYSADPGYSAGSIYDPAMSTGQVR